MNLRQSSDEILTQLIEVLDSIEAEHYHAPVSVLSQGGIGTHVRHIIEFYNCMLIGLESGLVDYDNRKRDVHLERDRNLAVQALKTINQDLNHFSKDRKLKLTMDLSKGGEPIEIETTFFRELAYNIEHAIHHMAIIRIAIQADHPGISVDKNFGVACSTIRYQAQVCAQ